ncbi:MAG: hypothetical protein H7125_11935 [Proteobacteria bacterium]|nr:hypothetical protein [Burkholderiales bacterium]
MLAIGASSPAWAQTGVDVSIGINQPGVYGRINIGDAPRPALVLQQPVIIVQQPARVEYQPVYLYVPQTHRKDWRRYCGRYDACAQPVYFVQERWVQERYDKHRRNKHHDDDRGHNNGKGKGKGHNRD